MTTEAILTELYPGQGLGNQLWVYSSSRSIAEELGVPFILLGVEHFKGNGFLAIDTEVGISAEEANLVRSTKTYSTHHEELYYDPDLNYVSSSFDESLLKIHGIRKIEGHLQSEQYFFKEPERIRKYITLTHTKSLEIEVPDSTCVINLRGGEYKRHKRFILPEDYWNLAIKNASNEWGITDFIVVTDDYKYAKSLFPKYSITSNSVEKCYRTLYAARHLIISNSTFSYFPIKTSPITKKVIAPQYWARFGNKLNRWASPANFYRDWAWQDVNGNLLTYDECTHDFNSTLLEYGNRNGLKGRTKILDFIPTRFKKNMKAILSYVFPKKFG